MNLSLKQTLSQNQVLSQNQTQSLKILEMNNTELNDFIWEMQLENPVLEVTQSHSSYEELVTLGQWYQKDPNSDFENFCEEEHEPAESLIYQNGIHLKDYLMSQIEYPELTKNEIACIAYLIDSLDEKGYLTFTDTELAALTRLSCKTVHKCVSVLKTFDPAGIGSYNLTECLCIQARKAGASENILTLINSYLDDIAAMRYDRISKNMGISVNEIKESIRFIKKLNPIPSNGFSQEQTQYIIPDILLTHQDNSWKVSINDKWIGDIKISTYYQKTADTIHDEEVLNYFEKKISHAKFIIKCIEQRRTTLYRVVNELVNLQEGFFLGTSGLKPLTLKKIADRLNIHESTVSRTIKDKYLACSRGSFLLRNFFVNGLASQNREESISSEEIKNHLKQLIDSENNAKPYSDNMLSQLLKKQNISISRRTIAKYREELGIGNTTARRF